MLMRMMFCSLTVMGTRYLSLSMARSLRSAVPYGKVEILIMWLAAPLTSLIAEKEEKKQEASKPS